MRKQNYWQNERKKERKKETQIGTKQDLREEEEK